MIKCKLVTPNKLIYKGEAESLIIPGAHGGMGILENHAPLISLLSKGKLIIKLSDKEEKEFEIEGGVVEVKRGIVSILTDKVIEQEVKV